MHTFYIKTLGCKVNQYESQVIRESFLKEGYAEVDNIDESEICVVNTCTVTSTSDSKSLRLIRSAIKKDKCVVATGCMVDDQDIDLSCLKGVEFIIKKKDKYSIPQIIGGAPSPRTKTFGFVRGRHQVPERKPSVSYGASTKSPVGISAFKAHTRAFVKIQDGCCNACSYCKVRVVRGPSRSRPSQEILDECKTLILNGSKELVLTGICLGAYGRDLCGGLDLCKLIREIVMIEGDWRLRLSSIEPKDINEDLIREITSQERLCKHIHMPFQSADDDILKRMNRPYTREDYLNIVYRLRDVIPDVAISTDIMVGFPGERDKEFRNTLDFISEVKPMRMHIFPYSKRKGTKAYSYKDSISDLVKKKRKDDLLPLARKFYLEFVDKFIGKEVRLLVEDKESKEGYLQRCTDRYNLQGYTDRYNLQGYTDRYNLQGYTDRYIKVYIAGSRSLKGEFLNIRLTPNHVMEVGLPSSLSMNK